LALLAAASGVALLTACSRPDANPPRVAYTEAQATRMSLETGPLPPFQLTGEVEHLLRGADSSEVLRRRLTAESEIERQAAEVQTAENLAAIGILALIEGRPDAAIGKLRAAWQLREDPRIPSDLAAAYWAQAESTKDPLPLVDALEWSSRAIALDPNSSEASWNHALVLDALVLRRASAAALAKRGAVTTAGRPGSRVDSTTDRRPTPEEVRAALVGAAPQQLEALTAKYPQSARLYLQEVILPSWGRATEQRRSDEAARHAALAGQLAAILARRGDASLLEETGQVQRLREDDQEVLAEGLALLGDAFDLSNRYEISEAERKSVAAAQRLRAAASPSSEWAELLRGLCAYHRRQFEEAARVIEPVIETANSEHRIALEARARWIAGLVAGARGDLEASLEQYRKSRDLFESLGEGGHAAAVRSLMVRPLHRTRGFEAAFSEGIRALSGLFEHGERERLVIALGEVAEILSREGHARPAYEFQKEAVALERDGGDAIGMADNLRILARLSSRVNDDVAAITSLREASGWVAKIADPVMRRRLEALVDLESGVLHGTIEPGLAVEDLNRALSFFADQGHDQYILEAFLQRAVARRALGDLAGADGDLSAGLTEYAAQASLATSTVSRARLHDLGRELLSEKIDMAMARGDDLAALRELEATRSQLV
jgi:tetratricopeptide (TPR) repeat protein